MSGGKFYDDPVKYYGYYNFLPDALAMLEEDDELIVIPPEVDSLTDNEEVDENNLVTEEMPHDIAGTLEIRKPSSDNEHYSSSDEEPLAETQRKMRRKHAQSSNTLEWEEISPTYQTWSTDVNEFSNDKEILVNDLKNSNPVEIFEKLCDESLLDLIVEQSMLYASQNNRHNFTLSKDELKTFIGILFLSGYHRLPQERLYWCLDEDVSVTFVASAMSRNRYLEIKQNLHFVDNSKINETTTDKMYKLRPLMNKLNENFRQWGIFHGHLSVDEAMVKYFGRHSSKQFIRGKPVRFGYKNWCLCSASGYCYAFDTYCGKNSTFNPQDSIGANVVLSLLEHVPFPERHTVYFDNYFSTISLMKTLTAKRFRATGTIRENRLKNAPISTSKTMAKLQRGSFEYKFEQNNELLVVRWVDNNVVTMISNHDFIEPINNIKRWSKSQKKMIEVPQPVLFRNYNNRMGGVDLNDQSVNTYRIAMRGKKWWWVLFTYMLDLCMTNAWKLYVLLSDDKMNQLQFVRYIVRHYVRNRKTANRRQPSVPESVSHDSVGHYPQKLQNQLRCTVCHSRIRWSCKKCKVTLCVERDCFEIYHSK